MKKLHLTFVVFILIVILGVSGIWVNIIGLWLILFGILGLTSIGTILSLGLPKLFGYLGGSPIKLDATQIKTHFLKELGPSTFLVLGVFISAMIASPWCEYDPSICEENLPMNTSIFMWGLCIVFILSMLPSIFRAIREKRYIKNILTQNILISVYRLISIGILYILISL